MLITVDIILRKLPGKAIWYKGKNYYISTSVTVMSHTVCMKFTVHAKGTLAFEQMKVLS